MTEPELFEPIGVHDIDFHVTKSIDLCPPGLQARELIKNGIEAELLPEEGGRRRILLSATEIEGVPKLAVFNTGRGMTPNELRTATDLAASIRKHQGLKGRLNRGEGAKVASLPWNHHGVRFRSCHNGAVSEVILKRVGDKYVRVREEFDSEFGGSDLLSVWDVTEEAAAEGLPSDRDWTEVVLFGQSPEQNTARFPYGHGVGSGTEREVLSEVFNRFYAVPDWVSLEADQSLHGRKGVTRFRLLGEGIRYWETQDPTKLRVERVTVQDGVTIEYVHLPTQSGSNNVFGGNEVAGNATRIALVWQGEMYDARIGTEWKKVGASFGLPYVHGQVSVLIHVPDDARVKEDAYRVALLRDDDSSKIEVEEFQVDVRQAMPAWLKELVDRETRPKTVADMSQVRAELERRLRRALVRAGANSGGGVTSPSERQAGASHRRLTMLVASPEGELHEGEVQSDPDRDVAPPEPALIDADVAPEPPRDVTDATQVRRKRAVKKRRPVQLVSNAPEIEWLDRPEQIAAETLEDRIGKYDEPTNKLFLNALYPAVSGKVAELEELYRATVDWEQIQDLVVAKVRTEMALHVGCVVVHALAKQRVKSWKTQDREKALAPEALTVAADQSEHLLGDIRTGLSRTGVFLAAKTPEPA